MVISRSAPMLSISPSAAGTSDRAHEALHEVGDVGEAARLLAGAVELELLALEGGADEHRLRPAPPGDVLPRAVAAEEAQDHALQLVALAKGEQGLLLEHLRDGVAPAAHVRAADDGDALLRERDLRVAPVAVRGGGQHHAPHAVIAARPQHLETAFAVGHQGVEGVAVARDLPRRQVDEHVRAARDLGEVGGIEDGAAMEAQAGMVDESRPGSPASRGRGRRDPDLVAAGEEALGQVRADEPGDARDGDFHAGL